MDTGLIQFAAQLGQMVRAARKAAGIRIDDAASLAGVSKQFLSDLERGKGSIQFDKAVAVAAQFGIELHAQPRGLDAMRRGL